MPKDEVHILSQAIEDEKSKVAVRQLERLLASALSRVSTLEGTVTNITGGVGAVNSVTGVSPISVAPISGDVVVSIGMIPESQVTNLVTDLTNIQGDITTIQGDIVTINTTLAGVITGVTAGTNLSGGGSSGDVTLNVVDSPSFAGSVTVGVDLDVGGAAYFGPANYVYIQGNQINGQYDADSPANLAINYVGFQGNVTQPRDTEIFDGKTNLIAKFYGTTKQADFAAEVNVGGQLNIQSGNAAVWYNATNSTNGSIYFDGAELVSAGSFWVNSGVLTAHDAFEVHGNAILGADSSSIHALNGTLNANSTAGSNGQILQVASGLPVWGAPSAASIPTGTGTTNQLVKWTGTNTQGDSIAYEIAGELHVAGSGIVVDSGTAAQANISLAQTGQTRWTLYQPASDDSFRLWNAVSGDTLVFGNDQSAWFKGNVTLGDAVSDAHTINGTTDAAWTYTIDDPDATISAVCTNDVITDLRGELAVIRETVQFPEGGGDPQYLITPIGVYGSAPFGGLTGNTMGMGTPPIIVGPYAGYFDGNVSVQGSLVATIGAFVTGDSAIDGELDMASHKIVNLADGVSASDAAAFGQIGTVVSAAVSGTTNKLAKFTGANTVGDSSVSDDGTSLVTSCAVLSLVPGVNSQTQVDWKQTGQTQWSLYQPASDDEFRLWNAVSGDTLVFGNDQSAWFKGNVTLGDSASDTTVINGHGIVSSDFRVGNGTQFPGSSPEIVFNYLANSEVTGYINKRGFAGGTTQLRNLIVGDGKNGTIATFTGSTKGLDVVGPLNGWTQINKSADQDVVSSTTLTDDTELQFPVVAGGIYAIEAHVIYSNNSASADYKCCFATSAGTIDGRGLTQGFSTSDATQTTNLTTSPGSTATNTLTLGTSGDLGIPTPLDARLTFRQNTSAGTLKLQFAGNSSLGTARTFAGSYIRYRKLN